MVDSTGQPYVFTNDNPLNAEDPLGTSGGVVVIPCYANCGSLPWRGALQILTVGVGGIAEVLCTASIACDLGGNALIGALTSDAVYAEGGGRHSSNGYAAATITGLIAGALDPIIEVGASASRHSVAIAGAANSALGAAAAVIIYLASPGPHTRAGIEQAAAKGAAAGLVPYKKIVEILRR
jgi:hypothetical protein